MSIEIMLLGLLVVSTLTGLTTEAIKKICDEYGKSYHSNILAGIVSLVLAIVIGIDYVIVGNIVVTAQLIVYLIALVFLSWLCAMVGYDKVIQTITQITSNTNNN